MQVYDLGLDDTLAGMIAKVRVAPGERVLFVVPPGLELGRVALRVLRRTAAAAGADLAFVAGDPALRSAAGREGISAFRTREGAGSRPWRPMRSDAGPRLLPEGPVEAAAPPRSSLLASPLLGGFRPANYLRAFGRRANPAWATVALALSLVFLVGLLTYSLLLLAPSATVRLAPAWETIRVRAPVTAVKDGAVDVEAGTVSAQTLSVQVSGEARTQTTGRRAEPDTRATGRVTFINRTSRDITVPAGTVVSTATGTTVQFATTAGAVLGGSGRATAPVQALLPGPIGNVRAGTITRVEGALALFLMVSNGDSFYGGTTSQKGFVTEEDKARLEAELTERLRQEALQRLNERVEGSVFVPAESVTFMALSPTFTPFVGEVSDELFLSMSLQAVGLGVDRAAAAQLGLARLQEAMPAGTRLISDTVRSVPGAAVLADARSITFGLDSEGLLLRSIDVDDVRRSVAGLSLADAVSVLREEFALAASPEITLGPDWLPAIAQTRLPRLPWRVRVIVDWGAAAGLALNAQQTS